MDLVKVGFGAIVGLLGGKVSAGPQSANSRRDAAVECCQGGPVTTRYRQQMGIGHVTVAGDSVGAELLAHDERHVIW